MQDPQADELLQEVKTPLGKVWLVKHEKLGLLVFDPSLQQLTERNQVRLYVVAEHRAATFQIDALKGKLKSPLGSASAAESDPRSAALAEFNRMNSLLAYVARHKGHCTWCGHAYGHNNFIYCTKCEWINCSCGDAQCPCTPYKELKPRPSYFPDSSDWREDVAESELKELYDELLREGMEYADMVYANKG